MFLYISYPSWIKPEIIPGFQFLRWYGLMYIFAFTIAFLLFRLQYRKGELQKPKGRDGTITEDDIISFFTWSIVGLLVGARIFATIIYDSSGLYWQKPWLIFWPFAEGGGWTGLQGMSYHGGFLGALAGMMAWCKRYKHSFLVWCDAMAAAVPLGYTFGRIGNFLNGELYGRVTTSELGIIFPQAPLFSYSLDWVRAVVDKIGMNIPAGSVLVNLPRHPSQLYEAFFEGLVLWAVIWFIFRNRNFFPGFITGIYTIGYGLVRFIIEYFREPDADIGYRITVDGNPAPTYLYESLLNISTGQILCLLMIAGGMIFLILQARKTSTTLKDSHA